MQIARNLPIDENDTRGWIEFRWSQCIECGATGEVTESKKADAQWTIDHKDETGHAKFYAWTVFRTLAELWEMPVRRKRP